MRIPLIVISLLFILGSCSNPNKEYLVQLSNLQDSLYTAHSQYNKVDSTVIANIRRTVKSNSIKAGRLNDKDFESTLIYYSHIDKNLKQIYRMDRVIGDDYDISVKQLDALYHDIENNILKEKVFKNYLLEEERIAHSVIYRMDFNTRRILTELRKFDSLNPIVIEHIK